MILKTMSLNNVVNVEYLRQLGQLIYECIDAVAQLATALNVSDVVLELIKLGLRSIFAFYDVVEFILNDYDTVATIDL